MSPEEIDKLVKDRSYLADRLVEVMKERDLARGQRDRYKRDCIVDRQFRDRLPSDLVERVRKAEQAQKNLTTALTQTLATSSLTEGEIDYYVRKLVQ